VLEWNLVMQLDNVRTSGTIRSMAAENAPGGTTELADERIDTVQNKLAAIVLNAEVALAIAVSGPLADRLRAILVATWAAHELLRTETSDGRECSRKTAVPGRSP
jgi:hypothetical protein